MSPSLNTYIRGSLMIYNTSRSGSVKDAGEREDKTTIKELLGPEVHSRRVKMIPKSFGLTIEDDVCG